jgi:hypothetical protein
MKRTHAILLCLLMPACLLQGCEAFVAGAVANATAIQSQEHAAYTDYLFETETRNKALQQAGQAPQTIKPKNTWLEEVYRPRLAYANYYVDYNKEKTPTSPLLTYEVWKEDVYKGQLEDQKKRMIHPKK